MEMGELILMVCHCSFNISLMNTSTEYMHKLECMRYCTCTVLYMYQNLLTEFCKMMLAKFHDIEKQERKLKRAFKVSFLTLFFGGPIFLKNQFETMLTTLFSTNVPNFCTFSYEYMQSPSK